MTSMPSKRDYSLVGRDSEAAVANGLAAAEWYHTDIPRKQMKELMKRTDGPAIRDTHAVARAAGRYRLRRLLVLGFVVACRFSFATAFSTARRRTAAGTNAATAPPSRRAG